MPRFFCNNEKCSKYQEKILITKVTFHWRNEKLVPLSPITCYECETELTHIKNNGVPVFNKFGSMSNADKRKMIVDRARKHDRTKMKDEVYLRNKAVKDNLKG